MRNAIVLLLTCIFFICSCGSGPLAGPHATTKLLLKTDGDTDGAGTKAELSFIKRIFTSGEVILTAMNKCRMRTDSASFASVRERVSFVEYRDEPLFTLNYFSDDRKEALVFLDSLVSAGRSREIQKRNDRVMKQVEFVVKKTDSLGQVIEELEKRLQPYDHIIDLQADKELDWFIALDSKRAELEMKRKALEDLDDFLKMSRSYPYLPPSVLLMEDEFLQKVLDQYYALQVDRQNLLSASETNAHSVEQVDQKMARMKTDMLIYIENSKKVIMEKLAEVNSELEKEKKKVSVQESGYADIKIKLESAEKLFYVYLKIKTELLVNRAGSVSRIGIIEIPHYVEE